MGESFTDRTKIAGADGEADVPDGWRIKLWAWSQYALYALVFPLVLLRLGPGWRLLWSVPVGWCLYNLWMTGHDACHNSIFSSRRPRANQAIAFLTLDCLLVSQQTWVKVHHKEHHAFPTSSVDGQRLVGRGVLQELWHVLLLLLGYLRRDLVLCLRQPTVTRVLTLVLRYGFLAFLAWKSGGWGLPLTLLSLIVFAAYFGLLSHSAAPLDDAVGFRQKQLSTTVDFLPGNWLAELLTGGLNTHAVHHVWPGLPRGLHGWGSRRLRALEPDFYRASDSLAACLSFWWHRQNPPPRAELPAPDAYYARRASPHRGS